MGWPATKGPEQALYERNGFYEASVDPGAPRG